MKSLTPYLPAALILATVAGVYFFYYKPAQDKKAAIAAGKQAAEDAALLSDAMQKYQGKLNSGSSTATTSAITAIL